MEHTAQHEFETPIGMCTIAWRANGEGLAVVRFRLPDVSSEPAQSHEDESCAPPEEIASIVERVRRHLAGELQDFRDVSVVLGGMQEFARRVLELTRQIPAGKTRTFGEIAKDLGQPHAAQAVGQALGANPIPLIIPCHRVLAAGFKLGGFSAPGGRSTKERLLEIERAQYPRSLFGGA